MNGYETVYRPSSGSKVGLKAHNCRPEKKLYWSRELESVPIPNGGIVCCDRCGQHWYLYIWGDGGSGLHTAKWYKVRWFHYGKKRRILGK